MFTNIMMVIVIAAIVATMAVHFIDLDESDMDKQTEESLDIKAKLMKLKLKLKHMNTEQVLKIAIESLGVGIGLVILKHVALRHPEFSWLCLIILVAFIIGLMYQWHKQGSDPGEFVCFTVLTLIAGGIACVAAANYASATIIPLLAVILLSIFAIGFYGFTAFKFYREINMLDDDERAELLKEKKNDTVKEMDKKVGRFNRLMAAVAVATLIALAGTTGVVLGMADSGYFKGGPDWSANVEKTTIAMTDTVNASTSNTKDKDVGADSRFVQSWAKNENNRIDSEFLPKLLKKANGDKITEDDFEEVLLDDCAHDARILAIVANNLKLKDDTSYDNLLTSEKKYLSDEGKKLYFKVEGALATSNLLRTEVDSSGTNTGMNGNQYVVSAENGVTGELAGTKITTKDGKITFYILDRCANVVYPGNPPGNIPRGDTDNPTPTPSYSKNPSDDSVNKGNANKGGGQDKSTDGSGENQPVDPKTEHPTGSGNDNNHGYSDPSTVTPSNPSSTKSEPVVTDSNPMDYKPDPVTNNGPTDSSKKPTSSGGDGEFTPSD